MGHAVESQLVNFPKNDEHEQQKIQQPIIHHFHDLFIYLLLTNNYVSNDYIADIVDKQFAYIKPSISSPTKQLVYSKIKAMRDTILYQNFIYDFKRKDCGKTILTKLDKKIKQMYYNNMMAFEDLVELSFIKNFDKFKNSVFAKNHADLAKAIINNSFHGDDKPAINEIKRTVNNIEEGNNIINNDIKSSMENNNIVVVAKDNQEICKEDLQKSEINENYNSEKNNNLDNFLLDISILVSDSKLFSMTNSILYNLLLSEDNCIDLCTNLIKFKEESKNIIDENQFKSKIQSYMKEVRYIKNIAKTEGIEKLNKYVYPFYSIEPIDGDFVNITNRPFRNNFMIHINPKIKDLIVKYKNQIDITDFNIIKILCTNYNIRYKKQLIGFLERISGEKLDFINAGIDELGGQSINQNNKENDMKEKKDNNMEMKMDKKDENVNNNKNVLIKNIEVSSDKMEGLIQFINNFGGGITIDNLKLV
jgi:hypothetical protein